MLFRSTDFGYSKLRRSIARRRIRRDTSQREECEVSRRAWSHPGAFWCRREVRGNLWASCDWWGVNGEGELVGGPSSHPWEQALRKGLVFSLQNKIVPGVHPADNYLGLSRQEGQLVWIDKQRKTPFKEAEGRLSNCSKNLWKIFQIWATSEDYLLNTVFMLGDNWWCVLNIFVEPPQSLESRRKTANPTSSCLTRQA